MKFVWILALVALAACGQPATTATVAPPTDPALAAIVAMQRPSPSSPDRRAGSHCSNSEAVVFSCAIAGKVASICVGPTTVNYRYGPAGAPELTIASTGIDGLSHVYDAVGGSGGSQSSVRFSNAGHEYIVHAMTAGGLTDTPGSAFAGITVMQGDATVSELACPDPAQHQFSTRDVPAQGEDDARYQLWW